MGGESQSPDGDFFDPESLQPQCLPLSSVCHSPLTGIFLIRSNLQRYSITVPGESQSPDGDFFDPEQQVRRPARPP